MKKKTKKTPIDTNSIHKGLIDNYKVDDKNLKNEQVNNVQDFQSVTESIEKLEKIIEDGKELANKDETYAKFLNDVKSNLEEQKSQLFKLKLTNAETNVASMLSNVDENATSNDFIAIEREIKRYSDVVFNLKSESNESSEKRSLWNSHHNKINIFHNRLQKKRIQRSVKASKDRVQTTITNFEKTIDNAKYTLLRKDLAKAKKSLKKMQLTIDEAQITGQKDEGYHEWLNGQVNKFDEYDKSIVEIDLKIDIEQHRKALEDAQPDVVKGINELNRNIEGSDLIQEELEEEINPEETDLWESDESNDSDQDERRQNKEPQVKMSPYRIFLEIIIYTSILIAIIYFTSNNYINLRNLNSELPIKERKLHLVSGKIVGEQIRNNKTIDSQNTQRVIFLSKLLTSITPKSIVMDEMTYTINEDNSFNLLLKGEVSGSQSVATKIFNKYVSDLRKQQSIKRVIVKDQRPLPKSSLIFTIDLRS
tara:strand:- start:12033 stop:13469 length:1437 start_codon:yes stop_codon:yes gene_type:complete